MPPLDEKLIHDVVRLDREGMKWRAIARALRISRNTVRQIVREHKHALGGKTRVGRAGNRRRHRTRRQRDRVHAGDALLAVEQLHIAESVKIVEPRFGVPVGLTELARNLPLGHTRMLGDFLLDALEADGVIG